MPHVLNVTVPIPDICAYHKRWDEELIAYSLDPVWNMSDLRRN